MHNVFHIYYIHSHIQVWPGIKKECFLFPKKQAKFFTIHHVLYKNLYFSFQIKKNKKQICNLNLPTFLDHVFYSILRGYTVNTNHPGTPLTHPAYLPSTSPHTLPLTPLLHPPPPNTHKQTAKIISDDQQWKGQHVAVYKIITKNSSFEQTLFPCWSNVQMNVDYTYFVYLKRNFRILCTSIIVDILILSMFWPKL